jgi:translation initiation factor IF-1
VDSDGPGGPGRGPEVEGIVTETLPHAMYRVRLDQGAHVLTHLTGRIDRNFVRILIGDRVRVALSPVDPARGRIVERLSI